MIREEVLLRPARRAAIFCVLVLAALLALSKTAEAATFSSGAPISIGGFANADPAATSSRSSPSTGRAHQSEPAAMTSKVKLRKRS